MDEAWRVSIGIILFLVGALMAFWAGSAYLATSSTFDLAAVIGAGVVFIIGLILSAWRRK